MKEEEVKTFNNDMKKLGLAKDLDMLKSFQPSSLKGGSPMRQQRSLDIGYSNHSQLANKLLGH